MVTTPPAVGDEQRAEAFAALVQRLSAQSVQKHSDAYDDVDWDGPGMAIEPDDPRNAVFQFDALGATEWYRSQPPEVQGRIGLYRTAYGMRVGMQFENILQRGLLAFAYRLPNGSPEFRYIHHEVAEESQHSMMFQEVVNRSGVDIDGMPLVLRFLAAVLIPPVQRLDPPLFFIFVLGGEEPIDHLQRRQLRGQPTHPLVEQILRIHVTEEARHVSFARQYLRTEVPKLGRVARAHLSIATPIVLGIMTPLMVDPPAQLTRAGVPREVIRDAVRSPEGHDLRVASVRKIRRFCRDLGLMNPAAKLVWRMVGLWDDDDDANKAPTPAN